LSFERQYSLPYIDVDSAIQRKNLSSFDENFFNKANPHPIDYQEIYELQLHNQAKKSYHQIYTGGPWLEEGVENVLDFQKTPSKSEQNIRTANQNDPIGNIEFQNTPQNQDKYNELIANQTLEQANMENYAMFNINQSQFNQQMPGNYPMENPNFNQAMMNQGNIAMPATFPGFMNYQNFINNEMNNPYMFPFDMNL